MSGAGLFYSALLLHFVFIRQKCRRKYQRMLFSLSFFGGGHARATGCAAMVDYHSFLVMGSDLSVSSGLFSLAKRRRLSF